MSLRMAAGCWYDADCNWNGKCVDTDHCECRPGWTGDFCDVLDLRPTNPKAGYQYFVDGQNVSSWGGSVVYGNDGLYHMYAAEMSGFCGLSVWLANSIIIHATSPDPLKVPFKRQSTVWDIFAHEPSAAVAPTGEYVIYFTATIEPNQKNPPVKNGSCEGCHNGNTALDCRYDDRDWGVNLPTYMIYSDKADGPWSDPVLVPGTDIDVDSNLAVWINDDGSLVGLTRHNVYMASDWRNMSTYKIVNKWQHPDMGEDPTIWRDENGIYHGMIHIYRTDSVGLHYYSEDGIHWSQSLGGGNAFTCNISYTDGTDRYLACRERPHLVFNQTGHIIALTNGAADVSCGDAVKYDRTYTSLQRVGDN